MYEAFFCSRQSEFSFLKCFEQLAQTRTDDVKGHPNFPRNKATEKLPTLSPLINTRAFHINHLLLLLLSDRTLFSADSNTCLLLNIVKDMILKCLIAQRIFFSFINLIHGCMVIFVTIFILLCLSSKRNGRRSSSLFWWNSSLDSFCLSSGVLIGWNGCVWQCQGSFCPTPNE